MFASGLIASVFFLFQLAEDCIGATVVRYEAEQYEPAGCNMIGENEYFDVHAIRLYGGPLS